MDDIRKLRNKFLTLTDKYTLSDYPITTEERTLLFAYRQTLRDLPENLPEVIDSNIMNNFPQKPSFIDLCPFS